MKVLVLYDYREEGTTTTPFDMQVRNRTSRYHLVIQVAEKIAVNNTQVSAKAEDLIRKYQEKLREHRNFIQAEGIDPSEVSNWKWTNG